MQWTLENLGEDEGINWFDGSCLEWSTVVEYERGNLWTISKSEGKTDILRLKLKFWKVGILCLQERNDVRNWIEVITTLYHYLCIQFQESLDVASRSTNIWSFTV
jgi:hypothetical protein